jgi:hypothetical protein
MRWVREPLLHFLLIGAALFALDAWWGAGDSAPAPELVRVTSAEVERLRGDWTAQAGRPPTDAELRELIADWVREEILVREAAKLDLHTSIHSVRQRLAADMDYFAEKRTPIPEPDDAALQAFIAAHADDYRAPDRVVLRHVFFSTEKRGERAEADARRVIAQTRGGAGATPPAPPDPGDDFLLPLDGGWRSPQDLRMLFGRAFVEALRGVAQREWTGPLRSIHGWHAVRLDGWERGALPALADIRERVRDDWTEAQRQAARDRQFEVLRARYRVEYAEGVPAPAAR